MDTAFWMLLSLAGVIAGVTWHAHRLGNERRDVVLLGTVASLLAIGSAAVAVF